MISIGMQELRHILVWCVGRLKGLHEVYTV